MLSRFKSNIWRHRRRVAPAVEFITWGVLFASITRIGGIIAGVL